MKKIKFIKIFSRMILSSLFSMIFICASNAMFSVESAESQNLREKYQQQLEQLNQKHGLQLYDFEKSFLGEYIQKDNIDETFMQKLFNYIGTCASSRSVQNINDRDAKFAQKDFAQFLLEYLIEKHILGLDAINIPATTESKQKVCSKRMRMQELEERERNLFRNLQDVLSVLHKARNNEQVCKFITANIGNNELLAGSLFVTRLLNVDVPFLEAVETEVTVSPTKPPIKKLTYNYWRDPESSDKPDVSVNLETKPFGAQFGGKIITNGTQSKKWYFKTHQEGSRVESSTGVMYLSKSISLANPVNVNELLAYKILEKLGWGPKVSFVANPFTENDMFIVTNDLEEESNGFTMAINCKHLDSLDPAQKEDLKVKVTAFDLSNRILMLNDLNEGNYGLSADNSIKVVDFRAPSQVIGSLNERIFYKAFLGVNGDVYPKPPKQGMVDQRLAPSILKQFGADEKQKIKEGIVALRLLDRNQLEQAGQEAQREVLAFISAQDNIASRQTAELIGLDFDSDSEKLENYVTAIMGNYDVIKECLTKKSESLNQD